MRKERCFDKRPKPYLHKQRGIPFATRLVDRNGNTDFSVDGSVEGAHFDFEPSDDVMVTEVGFTFEIKGEVAFGSRFLDGDSLKRGLAIQLESYGQDIDAVFRATRDLVEYASPGGFDPIDMRLSTSPGQERAAINGRLAIVRAVRRFSDGLMLRARCGDGITLTVQDDLGWVQYAVASVFGYTV